MKKPRPAAAPPAPPAPRLWPLALAVAAAAFLVFSNAIDAAFVWDDEAFIQRNLYLTAWGRLPLLLTRNIIAGAGQTSNLYRPLQSLTHFLDVRVWGLVPWGHHLTNVLLHAAASSAVFLWLAGFAAPAGAAAVASLYALHPLQSEAVAYVSGRGDTLAILFLCLGLAAFDRGRRGAALACAALAMFSKESLALFPVFLLLDRLARGEAFGWKAHLPFWLLAGAYAGLRLSVLNFHDTLNFYGARNLVTDNALYRFYTYVTTLTGGVRLWLWPSDLHHERHWPFFITFALPPVWLSALGVGLWLAAAAWLWRRSRPAAAGLLFFVIATIPTSNLLVVINALFYDHWFILPGLGLALALTQIPPLRAGRRWAAAAVLVLAAAGAVGARRLNAAWHDPLSLNAYLARYEPRNAKIQNNLAMALSDAGRVDEAILHYKAAVAISDEYPQTHHNLGQAYLALGRTGEAEAEYRRATEMDPRFYHSQLALGWLALDRGRLDEARERFEAALAAYPYAASGYLGLAQARWKAGDPAGAARELERGLAVVDDPALRAALARIKH